MMKYIGVVGKEYIGIGALWRERKLLAKTIKGSGCLSV